MILNARLDLLPSADTRTGHILPLFNPMSFASSAHPHQQDNSSVPRASIFHPEGEIFHPYIFEAFGESFSKIRYFIFRRSIPGHLLDHFSLFLPECDAVFHILTGQGRWTLSQIVPGVHFNFHATSSHSQNGNLHRDTIICDPVLQLKSNVVELGTVSVALRSLWRSSHFKPYAGMACIWIRWTMKSHAYDSLSISYTSPKYAFARPRPN